MRQLTYEEVITAIENKRRFGNLKGIEISKIMLETLGHPERDLPVIHIAGTNGKGSVSAFLRSILTEAGLKTGMFTSPHLIDFSERIEVDGEKIAHEDAARLGQMLLETDFGVYPTMFDYCLAMAFLYFKEQKCDVVILETGLGGKFDSTNACKTPDVTVITKIGYDHMAILGDTLTEIASEKAGIIKPGTALVLGSQEKEAMDVLLEEARRQKIETIVSVNPEEIEILPMESARQCFSYGKFGKLSMRMLGVFQYENAAAAALAADAFFEKMKKRGTFKRSERACFQAVRKGIAEAFWMGRMEIAQNNPFFLLDGAHNSSGVDALEKSLETLYPGEKFHFIMGVMADKDYGKMIGKLLPLALDFQTVHVENERAVEAEKLASYIKEKGVAARACADMEEIFVRMKDFSAEKTVAFGSLYFIGEIERILREKNKNNESQKEQNNYKIFTK